MSTSWRRQSVACFLLSLCCAGVLALVRPEPSADMLASAFDFILDALLMLVNLWQLALICQYYRTYWHELNRMEIVPILLAVALCLLSVWISTRYDGSLLFRLLHNEALGMLIDGLVPPFLLLAERQRKAK